VLMKMEMRIINHLRRACQITLSSMTFWRSHTMLRLMTSRRLSELSLSRSIPIRAEILRR
jgi:hypothetical protein